MSDSKVVTLRGGVVVPLSALRLAWALEDRGRRFAILDDGALSVRPRSALTDEDREAIRRQELRAIIAYRVPDDARL